jgi:hypothetical protein
MKSNQRNIAADLVLGAVAGAAATWVMGKATTYLYEHESREAREREDSARGDKNAYEVAAEKAADVLGRQLSEEERKQVGSAIHWALGVGSGALYGALRPRIGGGWASGALFGAAVWLLMDEVGNVALGLTPGPTAFPWQAHARGLAGHLVLGLAVEGVLRAEDETSSLARLLRAAS